MLPLPTLRKIVRDCFLDDDPKNATANAPKKHRTISVAEDEREQWLNELSTRLTAIEHVTGNVSNYRRAYVDEEPSFIPGLFVKAAAGAAKRYDYVILKFDGPNRDDGLWMHHARRRRGVENLKPTQIGDVAQLEDFLEKVVARQQRDKLREKQTQKVANFRQTALTSKLKELGKEHNFSFAIGQTTRDVNLSIRVAGRKRGFHFAFPKGKLDAVIEQVPDLISMLENLQSLGVNFRTHNKRWAGKQSNWIEPPKSKNKIKK